MFYWINFKQIETTTFYVRTSDHVFPYEEDKHMFAFQHLDPFLIDLLSTLMGTTHRNVWWLNGSLQQFFNITCLFQHEELQDSPLSD